MEYSPASRLPGCRSLYKRYTPYRRSTNSCPRWRGEEDAPSLMLMGHVDVVPVEDEARQDLSPFSGVVAGRRN
mgnify:CR=1 FL=1